jgi:hypothetical protein
MSTLDPQRPLSRNQLAAFLPTPEAIKAFERLMQNSFVLTPAQITVILQLIDQVIVESGNALSAAHVNASLIQALESLTAALITAPQDQAKGLIDAFGKELQALKISPKSIQLNPLVDYATAFLLMGG